MTPRQLRLLTPEGIVIRLPLAGLPSRGLALVVDVFAVGAALQTLGMVLGALAVHFPGLVTASGVIAEFLLTLLYAAACEWFWQGQTLGKRLLGLRVLDAHGLPLTGSQILMRNLLRVVDGLPAFYLVGGLASLRSDRAQRVGDLVAGTVVVQESAVAEPDLAAWQAAKYNSFLARPELALRLRESATPAQAGLVLQALLRRDQLDPAARVRIYRELMDLFQARVAFPPEITEPLSPEQYLRNVAAVLFPRRFSV